MNKQTAHELLLYIAKNIQTESAFLSPHSTMTIETIELLDKIAKLRNIDIETNDTEFNEIMKNLQK